MTQATTKDYWISSSALHIELNALGNPDYIQASCVSGAQILVYVKDIIGYDAGHNYRRWPLQASPTVFNSHTEKYVYAAIPRSLNSTASAWIVFPSELIDIYGKNEKEEQIGDERYYYIFMQGKITSSGDNGTTDRDWDTRVFTGYLSSDEALDASTTESEWYKYSSVDSIVTFLKDLTMKAGTKFREFFAKAFTIVSGGSLTFEGQGTLNGIVNDNTPLSSVDRIVTPKFLDDNALSSVHEDTAQKAITFMEGLKLGKDGKKGLTGEGDAVLGDVVVDRAHDPHSTEADRSIIGAQGFDLYMGADGKSHMYIDYLTTRVKMFAAGAEIRKVSYSGGTTIFSNAGSTIVKVAYVMDANGERVIAYKCYAAADDGTTRTMNWWRPGMMAMCQTFNVKAQTEGELDNRYYWRLVVAVGQETLEDGRLYDYVVLSNVERFHGTDEVVPSYGLKLLTDGSGKVLTFGGAAVAVAAAGGLTSFGAVLKQDGVPMDDKKNSVSDRNYAGYEPAKGGGEPAEGGGDPDAPMAGDVIVQVGDQVKWMSRGNVIKLSTSTEDDASGTAPAIAMYHGIGQYDIVNDRQDLSSIWNWRVLTFLASPAMTYVNSKNFKIFTDGDIDTAYDVTDRFTSIEGSVTGIKTTVAETKKTVGEVQTDLTTFKQTSKEFSLKVGQRSEGRYNLLTGTAFKRKEASWTGNDTYEPWISTVYQYDGINAVVIEGAKGKNRGVDFLRVKVGRNRKHTISAMLACDGDVAYRDFGVYIVQKDAQMNDIGNNLSIYCKVAKNMITGWNIMTETFELDARTVYADCVFIYSGEHTARIALPMLTEGGEYLGWSLSEGDCNYRGGNLLARTDTLTSGDGLTVSRTLTKLLNDGDADRYGSYATLCTDLRDLAVGRIDTVMWNLSSKDVIKQGQDYMLSFMAKGDSEEDDYAHIAAFLHKDGTPDVAVEICGHVINTSTTDGEARMSVSGKWQKYYVHWRVVGDSLPQFVVLRTYSGSRLFVSQIKLEVGATATEWTAESSDYVEDRSVLASLLDTGIDINNKEIKMTAEKTKFRTRTGQEVAVFDEDGLNADLINVKHLWAVGQDGTKKVGYFGNCEEDACKVDDQTYAPLFLGAETAKGSNFYVTADGTMHSKNADVEGKVAVSQLVFQQQENVRNKPYDGAVAGAGNYVMPRLKAGEFRIVKVFNLVLTRTIQTLNLSGEDDTVKFLYNDECTEAEMTATLSVYAPDIAEIVGFGQYINLENGLKRYLYTIWKYVEHQKTNKNN